MRFPFPIRESPEETGRASFACLDENLIARLDAVLQDLKTAEDPIYACSPMVPAAGKRDADEAAVVNYCSALTTNHLRTFEVWSDGERTEIVLATTRMDEGYYTGQLSSAFKDAKYTELGALIPPWLESGLYFKVLNCRMDKPFAALNPLSGESDPLVNLVKTFEDNPGVRYWVSIGFHKAQDPGWGKWARDYFDTFTEHELYRQSKGAEEHLFSPGLFAEEGRVTPSSVEREVARQAEEKANRPNIVASMRIALFSPDPAALRHGVDVVSGAVHAFKGKYTRLEADPAPFEVTSGRFLGDRDVLVSMAAREAYVPSRVLSHLLDDYKQFTRRGGTMVFPYLLLSPEELAVFVHLPAWAGGVLRSLDWTRSGGTTYKLPPERGGILLGKIFLAGEEVRDFRLPLEDLQVHAYIMGETQTGKSTLLANIVAGLAEWVEGNRLSVILIDPHGDLAFDLLTSLPSLDRVYFFDPLRMPFGMNLLALPRYSSPEERTIYRQWRVDTVKRMFKEVMTMLTSRPAWGSRLEMILSSTLTAFYDDRTRPREEADNPTLLELREVVDAIGDEEALRRVAAKYHLNVEELLPFSDFPKEAKIAVSNKINPFTFDPFIRRFTCNRGSNLDFADLTKPGRIAIFSLSRISNDLKAVLMGSLILNIYNAVMQNAQPLTKEERWPVLLLIDEFQRASRIAAFEDIITEAGKYRLSLILAHQNPLQIPSTLRDAVMGNVATTIIFRVGGGAAKALGDSVDLQLSREIADTLATQPAYRALVRMRAKGSEEQFPPCPILTKPPPENLRSASQALAAIEEKMAPYRPELAPERTERPCMRFWEEYKSFLPPPEAYPVYWAVREFNENLLFPDVDELHDFAQDAPYMPRRRRKIQRSLERLLRLGLIREGSALKTKGISYVANTTAMGVRVADLVLLESSSGRIPQSGEPRHRHALQNFMRYYVRQKMFLPLIVKQSGGADPDGILVPPRPDGRRWDLESQIAVEVETTPDRNPGRVKSHLRNDLQALQFSRVIVVCTTRDGKRAVERLLRYDPELGEEAYRRTEVLLWEDTSPPKPPPIPDRFFQDRIHFR